MWFVQFIILCYLLILRVNGNCIILHIRNGLICGSEKKTVGQNSTYLAFRGIPYAQPPNKEHRFEPPVPKENWDGILDAKKDGNMCVQGNPPTGNEDCLFINVYVPKPKVPTFNLLHVMVFIHGGGFETGNSNYDIYGPDYLLEKGVIVVTFNYRLGIFGFLSTGDLVAPGNNGMRDQVLALKWVRNNIKYFGGDSSKVTIFGESAGGASVSYHMQSKLSRGLFKAAVMQSGVSLCSWALSRQIPETVKAIAQNLSVNANDSRQLVNGLKQIDYKRLQSASTLIPLLQYDVRDGLAYGPVVEPKHEDAFFTVKSHYFLQNGGVSRTRCMVGFNSLEFVSFLTAATAPLLRLYMQQYDINITMFVPIDLNVRNDQANATGAAIKKKYIGDTSVVDSLPQFIKFLSDDCFVRPVVEFVRIVANFIPTYLYRFSYEGEFLNRTNPGVGHAEDLPYVWRMSYNLTQADSAVRDRMVTYLTNFAKTRTPDDEWKQNDDKHLNYFDIGKTSKLINHTPQEADMKFWINDIYQVYGNPPYDTF